MERHPLTPPCNYLLVGFSKIFQFLLTLTLLMLTLNFRHFGFFLINHFLSL